MISQYTEEQVLGYLILTLKNLGKDDKEIERAISQMSQNMEIWTEEYAEEVYEEF